MDIEKSIQELERYAIIINKNFDTSQFGLSYLEYYNMEFFKKLL